MKTITVLSDTHGNLNLINEIYPILRSCDYVFHLGDCFTDMNAYKGVLGEKLITVKGNCDICSNDRVKITEIEGKRLLLTHGDAFGVKTSLTKLSLFAEENGVEAVFFGHTHYAECTEHNGITFINPGALARMCTDKSFAFVSIVNGKILCNFNRSFQV